MTRTAQKQSRAVPIQRKYYTDTAERYDSMHAHEGAADPSITKFVIALARMLDAQSFLDVGSASGRGLRDLKCALSNCFVCGVEPVAALIQQGIRDGNFSQLSIVCGAGETLPFPDQSFDVVCEFATLHHVEHPSDVVREMLRVARKAVIICDSNRFGQGSTFARLLKVALYKLRLWNAVNFVRTRGKGYTITEGDGLAYSYSAYDSFDLLTAWADRVIPIPCGQSDSRSWFHPLLTSGGVLLCAIKD